MVSLKYINAVCFSINIVFGHPVVDHHAPFWYQSQIFFKAFVQKSLIYQMCKHSESIYLCLSINYYFA